MVCWPVLSWRCRVRMFGALISAVVLAAASLTAQSAKLPAGAMFGVDPSYKVPRTLDGRPDLQGVWSNNSVTPMTRPTQWKDKERLTEAELTELQMLVAKYADDGGDAIFQSQVQLALDAKEKGKFNQTSYDPTRATTTSSGWPGGTGTSHVAHHRSAERPVAADDGGGAAEAGRPR